MVTGPLVYSGSDSSLGFPKRPAQHGQHAAAQEALESIEFDEWLTQVHGTHALDVLSPFEHNLEVWRQLWRVLERSDVVCIIADVRNPLLHVPPALYEHLIRRSPAVRLVIVLSKIDLVDAASVDSWKAYLAARFPAADLALFSSKGRPAGGSTGGGAASRRRQIHSQLNAAERRQVRAYVEGVAAACGVVLPAVDDAEPSAREQPRKEEVARAAEEQEEDSEDSEDGSSVQDDDAIHRERAGADLGGDDGGGDKDKDEDEDEDEDEDDVGEEDEDDMLLRMVATSSARKNAAAAAPSPDAPAGDMAHDEVEPVNGRAGASVDAALSDEEDAELDAELDAALDAVLDGAAVADEALPPDGQPTSGGVTVGFVGHPNVGKTSLLNALVGRKVASVSRTPGHTKHLQTWELSPTLTICDSPGLVFPVAGALVHGVDASARAVYECCGLFPIAQVREPFSAVRLLAQSVDLVRLYNLKQQVDAIMDEEGGTLSPLGFCLALAERKGYSVARGRGALDPHRAGLDVLKDCVDGVVCLAFAPPASEHESNAPPPVVAAQ